MEPRHSWTLARLPVPILGRQRREAGVLNSRRPARRLMASIGIAFWAPYHTAETAQLIQQADRALYESGWAETEFPSAEIIPASRSWKSGSPTVDEISGWDRPFTRTVGSP